MLTQSAVKSILVSAKEWETFLKLLHSTSSSQEISFNCGQPYLDKNIEIYKVRRIISKTKTNKRPGIDRINNNFYKLLSQNWIRHITNLFNAVLEKREALNSWSKVISMIFRKGDPTNSENYRRITLMNNITKIFTSILADRIINWCESNKILMEDQNGFRKGKTTENSIFVFNAKISAAATIPKNKLFIAFIDFKRAFDTVKHERL